MCIRDSTITDAKRLRDVIEQVRADDYCLASEEHELGIHALSVPVRNLQGKTVAAVNVVAPLGRLPATMMRQTLLPLLIEAANEIRPLI